MEGRSRGCGNMWHYPCNIKPGSQKDLPGKVLSHLGAEGGREGENQAEVSEGWGYRE